MIPARISDELAIISQIDPAKPSATTLSGDVFDLSKWKKALVVACVGTLGTSACVDVKLQCATTSGGTYADFSPAKAITQLTKVGSDDNKQVLLNLDASALPEGKRWVKPLLTVTRAATFVSLTVLGGNPRHAPVDSSDLASVDEIA